MKIQISPKYDSTSNLNQLDGLIKSMYALFDKFETCSTSGYNINKFSKYESVLLSHLVQKTNFVSVLDQLKSSYSSLSPWFSTILRGSVCKLGQENIEPKFSNFLGLFNKKVENIKNKPLTEYNYFVPVNLKLNLGDSEKDFIVLLNRLDINVGLPDKLYEQLNSDTLRYFFKKRLVLNFKVKARDHYWSMHSVIKKVELLMGLIAMSKNYDLDRIKSNIYGETFLEENPISDLILITEGETIISPSKVLINIIELDLKTNLNKLLNTNYWEIKKDDTYERLTFFIKSYLDKDDSLKKMTDKSMSLYFQATIDKNLELSFLKFWISIEYILKSFGGKSDESILNLLKKIILDKHLEVFIENLNDKRNDLVHEFRIDISQEDRNLTKILNETILTLLLDPQFETKTKEEFGIMLNHLFQDIPKLENEAKIINRLIMLKSKKN